jgi:dTDP-4-amino-4,6-dideoxygalactose transaminase
MHDPSRPPSQSPDQSSPRLSAFDSGAPPPNQTPNEFPNQASGTGELGDFFPAWPPSWPEIDAAVAECLHRGDWGRYRGQAHQELTRLLASLGQSEHCRLVSSGSIGIEIALRVLGVGNGDEVILCGYDYPGNFRAVEAVGARPLLADADTHTYSLSPASVHEARSDRIKAVIVSHLYGVPAEISSLRQECDRRGWKMIEDACQVPGMRIEGRSAGSWGDIGVFSFGGSKPLTAGTGGALLTNESRWASKWNGMLDRPSDSAPMSELQAAALIPQLARLESCNETRSNTTQFLLASVPWLSQAIAAALPSPGGTTYKLAFIAEQRDPFVQSLRQTGLPVGPGYRSMHRSSNRRCGKLDNLDRCRELGTHLCLLDHRVLLSGREQRDRLAELLAKAGSPGTA